MSVPASIKWREAVAEDVGRHVLGDAGAPTGAGRGHLDAARVQVPAGPTAGEEPLAGVGTVQVGVDQGQRPVGQEGIAVLPALPHADTDQAAPPVEILGAEANHFAHAQARGVGGGEDGPVLGVAEGVEEATQLLAAEHRRQAPFAPWTLQGQVVHAAPEHGGAEEPERGDELDVVRPGHALPIELAEDVTSEVLRERLPFALPPPRLDEPP